MAEVVVAPSVTVVEPAVVPVIKVFPAPASPVSPVTCTVSYALAGFNLIIAALLIIIPWAFISVFSLASAFIVNVLGVLLLAAAIAHLYYTFRVVSAFGRCQCP